MACEINEGERFYLGQTRQVFDCWVEVDEYMWESSSPWHLIVKMPWGICEFWAGGAGAPTCLDSDSDNSILFWPGDDYPAEWVEFDVERCGIPELALENIGIARRYGDLLYLKGLIIDIVETDDLCIFYSRPGDADLYHVAAEGSKYLHIENYLGNYDFEAEGRYIKFSMPGRYILELWRVDGGCSVLVERVSQYAFDFAAPPFQYQLIFDLDSPYLGESKSLLEQSYADNAKSDAWQRQELMRDCWRFKGRFGGVWESEWANCWLCSAIEFGASGCPPLSWRECPDLTPREEYFRGECDCDEFSGTLSALGIPCKHLIEMMDALGGKPLRCPYVSCD